METFLFCLPSNGGSPWYPSNQFQHWGRCSFCHLCYRCCCPSQGTSPAASTQALQLEPSMLGEHKTMINMHMLQAAFTSVLNSLLCNHICGILNPNLNCLAGAFGHLFIDSPSLLPHTQPSDTRSTFLSPSLVMTALISISLRFVS